MAYTDPQPLSQSRIVSLVAVVLIHVLLLYWLFNGGIKQTRAALETMDLIKVEDPPPPPEKLPPPPPPDKMPPPPETPVIKQIVQTPQPQQQVYNPAPPNPPPPSPPTPPAPPAPPAPPPPAPPPPAAVALTPRGDASSWFSPDDIPDSIKRERQGTIGTTAFTVQVGANGRVTGCTVTASSGESRLDDLTCRLATSRGRFNPGTDSSGNKTGGVYSRRVSWRVQTE